MNQLLGHSITYRIEVGPRQDAKCSPCRRCRSVLDLHDIALPDATAASVICLDTLEHVEYPRKAMAEMHRMLRPDGILVVSSVFNFPIHNYPNDYWRFTPEGFRSLLQAFEHSEVFSFGVSEISPKSIVGVGFKVQPPDLRRFREDCKNWERWHNAVIQKMLRTHQQAPADDSEQTESN